MANQPKKYKKFVATAATATLVASAIVPVASAASLSDIAGNTHEEAINALVDAKVISGYPDGTFKPNKTLTRSDVVKLLGKYLETEGYAPAADYATNPAFNDLKAGSNEELLKYASIVKEAGVFAGSNGNLLAGDKITRENMAITLVRMINTLKDVSLEEFVAAQDFKGDVKDLNVAKAEARSAIAVLDFYDITNPAVSNFNPKGDTTRGQFATFLHKTINADFAGASATTGTVKAINNTTVEVTFGKEIADIKALDFAIEGLTVENAVVKQTDKKTAVITTSAQEAGKEYTVTEGGKAIGKFTGIVAVIPTAINVTTASVQGTIGKEVTVKAQVTVPEGQSKAGIPVTFNIVNDNSNLNAKIEDVAYTDENGVASYSYTRYYEHNDSVVAYATQKSTVVSDGKVYWNAKLAITEITTGNELANNAKKSYKVTGAANTTYYIAIKENLGKTPDKYLKDVFVQDATTGTFVTPYELTTGATSFATVKTNAAGEGSFTVHGEGVEVTPIVYSPETTPTTPATFTYNKKDLQAEAPTVKFSQVNLLDLSVVAEGTADSAQYLNVPVKYSDGSVGGREYTVTVTDTKGNVAPQGTKAYVTFAFNGDVYFSTGTKDFVKVSKDLAAQEIVVGKDGKAKFRVAGKGNAAYVTPTVFLNTAGKTDVPALDKTDIQKVSEPTYFKAPNVVNGKLTVEDIYGREVTTIGSDKAAYFIYQSVDQNGFDYVPTFTTGTTSQLVWIPVYGTDSNGNQYIIRFEQQTINNVGSTSTSIYTLSFDVTSLFGNVHVTDAAGNQLQNLGNTNTYRVTSDAEGKAIVRVQATGSDTVNVNVTGVNNYLPSKSASVSFVATSTPVVLNGKVTLVSPANETVNVGGHVISYKDSTFKYGEASLSKDQFYDVLTKNDLVEVKAIMDSKGVYHFTITNVVENVILFTSQTNVDTASDVNTLGLVGTKATSSTDAVATAEIKDGKVAITSKGKGTAVITVVDEDTKTTDATINVTVSETGKITLGPITKAETEVIGVTLSEITTFVNATALGAVAVIIEPAQLTGDLKDATALVLTVKGKTYEATLEDGEFFFSIPTSEATLDEVKAGKVTKK